MIRSCHFAVFIISFSLLLVAELFAGIPQKQADAATVGQTPPQSAQKNSKHSTPTKAIKYVNSKYGFTFSLPATWKGYSAVEGTWESAVGDTPKGPSITLTNPKSTSEKRYQDICIKVFNHAEWDSLQRGEFAVSAASVGPGELGRNRKSVFAVPPRMIDSDNLLGWEEVWGIMRSNPLHAF